MRCFICNQIIVYKRTLKSFFLNEKYLICDRCYKENPINIEHLTFPLNNGKVIHLYSLFNMMDNYSAYLKEYSFVVNYYLDKNPLLYDFIEINQNALILFSNISKIIDKDIYVIAYECRISY